MEKLIKQDINFMEYNLWMQDEEFAQKTEGYIWKDREGYVYRAGYKPPVKTDFIFLLSLLMQSQQEGWQEEITCTRYQILQDCGIQRGKKWYIRLEDSLTRWQMMGIEFRGTFYDGKSYQTMNFGIIDDWRLEKETKHLIIRFNRLWLLKIKESNFFKYIKFDQIKALKSPLVVRLYEILLKNFQGRNKWEIDALKLAQKIPMAEKYVAHIILKIEAAVNRINTHSDLKIKLTTVRVERGKAIFIFEKVAKELETLSPMAIDLPEDEIFPKLIALLPLEHQSKKTILELIATAYKKHGFEYVSSNIRYANQNSKNNYRAYLNKAIKENWGAAIIEEEVSRKEAKAQEKDQASMIEQQKKEDEDLKRRNEKLGKQALAYIESLSPKEKEGLRQEAINRYRARGKGKNPPKETILETLIRNIVMEKLGTGEIHISA